MIIQKSQYNYDCLPAAFAIACDIPIEKFKSHLVYRDKRHIFGWHIQECIWVAYKYKFVSMCIDRYLSFGPELNKTLELSLNINDLMNHKRMVLLTDTHAVASNSKDVYDPNGTVYRLDKSKYEIVVLLNHIDLI